MIFLIRYNLYILKGCKLCIIKKNIGKFITLLTRFGFHQYTLIMKGNNQRTGLSIKKPVIQRIEKIHPFKMINYLVISVTCLLYAFITFMFVKHLAIELDGDFVFELPKFFTVSTLFLICSVYFTTRVLDAYHDDDITRLRRLLSFTLVSGLLFFISQSIAWMELLSDDLNLEKSDIGSYIFTFSAIHLTFILAGMIMSGILFYRFMLVENDPVKTLIITTNPAERVKLEIHKDFWHFNVVAWTMIFLLFLFLF